MLSPDQIGAARRLIYTLKKKKNVKDVFKLASEGLDIHVNTLYKIRGNFSKEGKVLCSFKGTIRTVRMKFVAMEWFEPMRIEAERIRLIEKRVVELLNIQIWILDEHNITIGRSRLRYRVSIKDGVSIYEIAYTFFKARIRKLRQDCLKRRHWYDKIIKGNRDRYNLFRKENLPLDDLKDIVYINLNEKLR